VDEDKWKGCSRGDRDEQQDEEPSLLQERHHAVARDTPSEAPDALAAG
jgi:hypothetical protein